MRRTALLVITGVLILPLLFISCGGGSSNSGVTPPAENLTGTYSLDYFYMSAFNCSAGGIFPFPEPGQLFCGLLGICPNDSSCDWTPIFEIYSEGGSSVSGTLVILDSSLHEAFSYSGQSEAYANSYTVTYTTPTTEGVLTYTNPDDPDPTFLCDGDVLTLAYHSEPAGLNPFDILKHAEWVKVSDEAVWPE